MNRNDFVACDYQELLEALDTSAFLGLPRKCHIRQDPRESFVTREMMIGNVPIVASYYIREDDLMLYVKGSESDEYGAHKYFFHGRKPRSIKASEDLAQFAAVKLVEHLLGEDEKEEEE